MLETCRFMACKVRPKKNQLETESVLAASFGYIWSLKRLGLQLSVEELQQELASA